MAQRLLARSPAERDQWAEELLDRLSPFMTALSIVFLLVVFGEQFARPGSWLALVLVVVGWLLWGVFVAEFLIRLVVAPDTGRFLKRNWWQILFLVLPFLRVLRVVRGIRTLRTARVLSSVVRSSRSARTVLGGRISWLAVLTAICIMASSQLLYAFGDYPSYGHALHEAALATIAAEPLGGDNAFSTMVELVLVTFSTVVVATLAGSFGAYFLEVRRNPQTDEPATQPG